MIQNNRNGISSGYSEGLDSQRIPDKSKNKRKTMAEEVVGQSLVFPDMEKSDSLKLKQKKMKVQTFPTVSPSTMTFYRVKKTSGEEISGRLTASESSRLCITVPVEQSCPQINPIQHWISHDEICSMTELTGLNPLYPPALVSAWKKKSQAWLVNIITKREYYTVDNIGILKQVFPKNVVSNDIIPTEFGIVNELPSDLEFHLSEIDDIQIIYTDTWNEGRIETAKNSLNKYLIGHLVSLVCDYIPRQDFPDDMSFFWTSFFESLEKLPSNERMKSLVKIIKVAKEASCKKIAQFIQSINITTRPIMTTRMGLPNWDKNIVEQSMVAQHARLKDKYREKAQTLIKNLSAQLIEAQPSKSSTSISIAKDQRRD